MLMLDEDSSDSGRLLHIAGPETEKVRVRQIYYGFMVLNSQYYWRRIRTDVKDYSQL
jgi:hypothetical protein